MLDFKSKERNSLTSFRGVAVLISLFINSFLSAQVTDGVYTSQDGSRLTISGCTKERLNYKLENSGFGMCDFDGEGKALFKMGNAFDVYDFDKPDFDDYTYAFIYNEGRITIQINISNSAQLCVNQLGSDVHNGIFKLDGIYKKAVTNLPVVKADFGDSYNKYKEWGVKPAEEEDGPTPPWTLHHNMCDGPSTESTAASSTLSSQSKINYNIQNICDDDPTTAWVEGKTDYGIGEYFELNWMPMGDGTISILNGYQSSKAGWENNSRVRKFKVSAAGRDVCIVELGDVMGTQDFKLPDFVLKILQGEEKTVNSHSEVPEGVSSINVNGKFTFYMGGGGALRFTIMEVYPGLKWKDTAISGIFSCGG